MGIWAKGTLLPPAAEGPLEEEEGPKVEEEDPKEDPVELEPRLERPND